MLKTCVKNFWWFMKLIISLVRKAIDSKFKVLGLKIIQDIKTDDFINILLFCQKNGWVKTYEYGDFDAWIDYGKVKLVKENRVLNFEWDCWFEGEISGKADDIVFIAKKFGLIPRDKPTWIEVK